MRLTFPIVSVALLALAAQPWSADAGVHSADEATCSKQTVSNTGEVVHGCMGTMAGFRNNSDPGAFAELQVRANGVQSFQAKINGVFFLCIFEDNYDAQYFAAIANNYQNTRFVIGSRDGACDMNGATLSTGSRYGKY